MISGIFRNTFLKTQCWIELQTLNLFIFLKNPFFKKSFPLYSPILFFILFGLDFTNTHKEGKLYVSLYSTILLARSQLFLPVYFLLEKLFSSSAKWEKIILYILIFDAALVFSIPLMPSAIRSEQFVWFSVHLSSNHSIYGKNHVFQQCTSYPSGFSKSVGSAFPSNLET